jgi:hypothetical protein
MLPATVRPVQDPPLVQPTGTVSRISIGTSNNTIESIFIEPAPIISTEAPALVKYRYQ